MRKISVCFIAILLIAGIALGEGNVRPNISNMGNPSLFPVGEHYPMIYTGTDTLLKNVNTVSTTRWMQVGYSHEDTTSNAEVLAYRNVGLYNPKYFGIDLVLTSDGDSVVVDTAYFEYAWDTTATPVWNAGNSNFFLCTGAYDSTLYDVYMWEPIREVTPSVGYHYMLAIRRGGYVRFVFRHHLDIDDDTIINWTFWCKN